MAAKNPNVPLTRLAPPDDGPDPTEEWIALTTIPRPHKLVPLPRMRPGTNIPVGEVAVWPLTQEEQMAANAEADRFTKRLMQDPQRKEEANLGYHHTYTNEVALQVLFRACRSRKDLQRPAFPSPDQMRAAMSTDELGLMFARYLTVKGELGPIASEMTSEDREALILRLQKGGSAFPFDSLSWEEQRTQVSFMASQLVSCWTAMSSAGLPLDAHSSTVAEVERMVAEERDEDPETPDEPKVDEGEPIVLPNECPGCATNPLTCPEHA